MKIDTKSYMAKTDEIEKKWFLVDAEGKTLGRLAVSIATILRGKHTPAYTPSIDTGDFVIVVNAEKIKVTGNKLKDKLYYRHSGYIGGLKAVPLEKVLAGKPEKVLGMAVRGMMPKGPLGRSMFKKLKVYAGVDHPHEAQKPQTLTL